MAIRISNPKVQRFNKVSPYAPLAGGLMNFYEPGQTVLRKTTFSDSAGSTANTNPVVLDANGFEPDIFGDGSYRVVLTDSDGVQIWDRDPVNFETAGGGFVDWSASTTYDAGGDNIVTGSDGKYYVSIQASSLNQDPAAGASPTFWTEFQLLKQYNANETYDINDPVTYLKDYYTSRTTSNTGNTPSTNPTNWRKSGTAVTIQKFTSSGTWTPPAGLSYIIVEVIGGGGGSAGIDNSATFRTGGGGGGGGYARVVLAASAASGNQTITVGAGGAGGSSGDNDGTAGGSSSFASLCVATGGELGEGVGGIVTALGGIGTTGDILAAGGAAMPDQGGGEARNGAYGGSSAFGAGGPQPADPGGDGIDGRNFGGGASGGWSSSPAAVRAGGAGSDGIVIVTEYY